MFRRVLSLVLLVELLLTQAFVCRCIASDEGSSGPSDVGMPHVHASRFVIPTTQKSKCCSCPCYRNAETTTQKVQSTTQLAQSHSEDAYDDAISVSEVVATRNEGQRAATDALDLLGLPVNNLVDGRFLLLFPPSDTVPPCSFWNGQCPIYLRMLVLLI